MISIQWMEKAACKDSDTTLFFPRNLSTRHYKIAKQICTGCPVRKQCYDYAVEVVDPVPNNGIWAGMPSDQLLWSSEKQVDAKCAVIDCDNNVTETAAGRTRLYCSKTCQNKAKRLRLSEKIDEVHNL